MPHVPKAINAHCECAEARWATAISPSHANCDGHVSGHGPRPRPSPTVTATAMGHGHGRGDGHGHDHGPRPRPRRRYRPTATVTATAKGHGHGSVFDLRVAFGRHRGGILGGEVRHMGPSRH